MLCLKINFVEVVKTPCLQLFNNKVNFNVKSTVSTVIFQGLYFKAHLNSVCDNQF